MNDVTEGLLTGNPELLAKAITALSERDRRRLRKPRATSTTNDETTKRD